MAPVPSYTYDGGAGSRAKFVKHPFHQRVALQGRRSAEALRRVEAIWMRVSQLIRPSVQVTFHMRWCQLATTLVQGEDKLHQYCCRLHFSSGLIQHRKNVALVVRHQQYAELVPIANPFSMRRKPRGESL